MASPSRMPTMKTTGVRMFSTPLDPEPRTTSHEPREYTPLTRVPAPRNASRASSTFSLHHTRRSEHGSELRNRGTRLAAARQLGSHAEIPAGARARAHEGPRARRDDLHVRRKRAV